MVSQTRYSRECEVSGEGGYHPKSLLFLLEVTSAGDGDSGDVGAWVGQALNAWNH
jgi:hypothetical protein